MKVLAKCIGIYQPDSLSASGWAEWLLERGYARRANGTSYITLRNGRDAIDVIREWHSDCNMASEYIIVWSNRAPTQLGYRVGANGDFSFVVEPRRMTKVQPKPYEVWLIDNTKMVHRRQPSFSGDDEALRQFARLTNPVILPDRKKGQDALP